MVGNLTMDRAAAAHIIGLPVTETDLATWWANWAWAVQEGWEITYWENESSAFAGAAGRLDIRASDDGYSMFGGFWNSSLINPNYHPWDPGFQALVEDASGNVTFNFWRIGYGEDILLMRQLYWGGESYGNVYPNGTAYGILPYECWLEDIDLYANMSETSADVYLDAGVAYGFRAWKSDTAPAGIASWRWENIRSDYMSVVPPIQLSEMDLWSGRSLKYTSWDSGSTAFGKELGYDYAPNVWNMVLGEVLVIERPTVMAVGYMPSPMIGNYSQLNPVLAGYYHSLHMLEKFGDATLHAVGCPAGTSIIDADTGDLTISGPFEPIKVMTPGYSWLLYEPAPRIEIWV
jgi:hypothetical protein